MSGRLCIHHAVLRIAGTMRKLNRLAINNLSQENAFLGQEDHEGPSMNSSRRNEKKGYIYYIHSVLLNHKTGAQDQARKNCYKFYK